MPTSRWRCPQGSIVALLGSNGAGKTTTLNAIAGLVPASGGRITFEGSDIAGLPAYAIVRKGLALSPEGWRLFVQQSVENNLLLGATPLADRSRIARMLERVYTVFPKLAERRKQQAGTMSGGERQMLAVGRALDERAALLLLDEPSLGLAPAIIETMYETFLRLHKEGLDGAARRAVRRPGAGGCRLRLRAAGRPQRAVGPRQRPAERPRSAAHLSGRRLSRSFKHCSIAVESGERLHKARQSRICNTCRPCVASNPSLLQVRHDTAQRIGIEAQIIGDVGAQHRQA